MFPRCKGTPLLYAGGIAVIIVIVGVLLFQVNTKQHSQRAPLTINNVEDYVINGIEPENIRQFLRHLTRKPHLGGTLGEHETAQWIADTWLEQGLDEVHMVPYQILLSYPSKDKPNLVRMISKEGIQWESAAKQKPLYAPEESLPELPFTFNGFAAPGNVAGDVVFAHYGRDEDFDYLAQEGIDITDKIILARYGKIFRANIADMAEKRGAIGLVLYSDPADYAPQGPDFVYPDSYFMPPSSAPFGTVKLKDGDPLTPNYPAIESAFRIPEDEAPIPKIPVQPISYEDAWHILSEMGGVAAPDDWQGGHNVTYRLGPGLKQDGWNVSIEVNNVRGINTTYNVVGVIKGKEEPDRYVILGNHYDAWLLGAVDPNSGTAAMMELSRIFLALHNETGWRPRRSLVFCAWGAEEYGLLGSIEFVEQFGKQLADRTVAYLNVDMSIEGNYTLRTKSSPILTDAVYESAKRVQNPNPDEVAAGRLTVYDTWVARRPDPDQPDVPLLQPIGSGSDYVGFQHQQGIPCMDTRYTHDNVTLGEPMYHTLYETFELVDEIYDQGFHYHTAVTAIWAHLALTLAETKVLPMSLIAYSDFISKAQDDIKEEYGDMIASRNISMEYFTDAAKNFNRSVVKFTSDLSNLDLNNPLAVRRINDQLMMVERAFIDPQGLPDRPEFKHVITAPSKYNTYGGTAFAGLVDTLVAITDAAEEDQDQLWRTFAHHLAAVTHLMNTAGKVLSDELW